MQATSRRRVAGLVASSTLASAALLVLYGYTGAPVTGGGTISGTVRMEGAAPRLAPLQVTRTPDVCGQTVPNEEIVSGGGGVLANVVVWIDGIQHGAPAKARPLTLDQQRCRFVPHVSDATVGSSLTLTSADPTLHTTHALVGDRTIFNVALPVKGMRVTRRLDRPGVMRLKCEAGHTWMSGWIHVFDHPYHAVTGRNGRFRLPDVPPGHYTLKAWHERLGEQTAQVDVAAGGTVTSDFRFRAH